MECGTNISFAVFGEKIHVKSMPPCEPHGIDRLTSLFVLRVNYPRLVHSNDACLLSTPLKKIASIVRQVRNVSAA